MNELLKATQALWLLVLESASELEPGSAEGAAHVSMLEAMNRGVAMVQHEDEGIRAVGYATLRYGFVAAKQDDKVVAPVALMPGPLMSLLEMEAALLELENGLAMDMRKSARGARVNAYSALATSDPAVIAAYISKLRNTCDRYSPAWGRVRSASEAMLAAFSGPEPKA
jgi:hypothetical protein